MASPLELHAQLLPKITRIGFLGSASATGSAKAVEAFRTGLRDLGYVEAKADTIFCRIWLLSLFVWMWMSS